MIEQGSTKQLTRTAGAASLLVFLPAWIAYLQVHIRHQSAGIILDPLLNPSAVSAPGVPWPMLALQAAGTVLVLGLSWMLLRPAARWVMALAFAGALTSLLVVGVVLFRWDPTEVPGLSALSLLSALAESGVAYIVGVVSWAVAVLGAVYPRQERLGSGAANRSRAGG